jgi:hypothetical protein
MRNSINAVDDLVSVASSDRPPDAGRNPECHGLNMAIDEHGIDPAGMLAPGSDRTAIAIAAVQATRAVGRYGMIVQG